MPDDHGMKVQPFEGLESTAPTRTRKHSKESSTADVPLSELRSEGITIGRYLSLGQIGAGGMGIILAAFDPELDRKIALKLLKAPVGDPTQTRSRLEREAQALAKLDHANVIRVYDVGVHGQQLFIAMEYVPGITLHEWMSAESQPRDWREVLAVFAQAGRGLAAAHSAGIIHRDFKPANAMLRTDGQVLVMDFGLARALRDPEIGETTQPAISPVTNPVTNHDTFVHTLTQSGLTIGTPAYMSPEQFGGSEHEVDTRADQFSYCVALFEALYGQRPFSGSSALEQLEQIRRGPVDEDTGRSKNKHKHKKKKKKKKKNSVPSWVRAVVVRGLAAEPDDRWPSMTALLAALADDPRSRIRRRALLSVLVVVLGSSVWLAAAKIHSDAQICEVPLTALVGIWDEPARASLSRGFKATGLTYAEDSAARVETLLGRYAEDWREARREVCELTQRGEQSRELLAQRERCLMERRVRLRATVTQLTAADEAAVFAAIPVVLDLPSLSRCAELDTPDNMSFGSDKTKAANEVSTQLIELDIMARLGAGARALRLAARVAEQAETLADTPTKVRMQLLLGSLQADAGDLDTARATLERAFYTAMQANMGREAARAASRLMVLSPAGTDQARVWALHANAESQPAGRSFLRSQYLTSASQVARAEGEIDNASEYLRRALTLQEATLGPAHPRLAATMIELASLALVSDQESDARAYLERARILELHARGPQHPAIAAIDQALAALP